MMSVYFGMATPKAFGHTLDNANHLGWRKQICLIGVYDVL